MATPYPRRLAAVKALKATFVVLVAAGAVWTGHAAWAAFTGQRTGTPSCSWHLHVRGKPTSKQVGLMRCYLKALAHRDKAGLQALADDHPPTHITKADLRHSTDARAGVATVTFTPNPSDPYNGIVSIAYADGAHDRLGIQNMIAFGGSSAWRLVIGTPNNPSPSEPPSASTSGPPPAGSAP